MQGWRTRLFHLTRNKVFLAKLVTGILAASILTALAVHGLRDDHGGEGTVILPSSMLDEEQLVESGRRLLNESIPDPAGLAAWLRSSGRIFNNDREPPSFDPAQLRLGRLDLGSLIDTHAKGASQDSFSSFTRCLFMRNSTGRDEARAQLERLAAASPSPPFANEFVGDLLFEEKRYGEALSAYIKEAPNPDAVHSRDFGLKVALRLNDASAARQLCENPDVLSEANPEHLWSAAKLINSNTLLFRALAKMQMSQWWQPGALALALLAAVIWYVVLVHSASPEPWRFVRYVPPVLAGVASVWLLLWWQGTLQYESDPEGQQTMGHEMIHWILYVGVPEEAAKLLLFLPFIPWLLRKKSGIKAALTAGCVGLGFALDENLHYFDQYGGGVAMGRLLTANFMHISLTGVLGWHLWDLFRSRFHTATGFVTAFVGVSAAHGLYDFSASARSAELGLDLAGIIILAFGARIYLRMLHPVQGSRHRMVFSSTSVFLTGSALLTGLLMVVLVFQTGSLMGITEVLKQALGLATVGLIYVREFNEL